MAWGGPQRLNAEDLVFKNGQRLPHAKIVARTGEFITVQTDRGIARYSLSTLASIDGHPVGAEPAPLPPAAVPAAASAPPAAGPPASSTKPAAAPAPAPESEAPPPPPGPDQWNFELFLLAFLVAALIWTRSLQAVQRDLFERRVEPRFWTLVALLLPGIGALAYFALHRPRRHSKPSRRPDAPPSGRTSDPAAPGPQYIDPAAHLAKKGHTRKGLAFLDTDRQSVALRDNGELASGLDNATEILEEALLEKASDIHIEPTNENYRVRFRLDGILHERTSYEPSDGIRLVTALKSLAQIDVSEKRRAQDGKFRVQSDSREVDFRVATANSIYGEKMVIRVLDHRSGIFDLASLGMSEEMLQQFQKVIHSKNGMILATGPTGSGKTSTLYAALRTLDARSLNIMTIEDPAEYELPGATQIAVNVRAGITYETGLRSILRQDPDVIFVGEMRDAEAAQVALRAALTGHLVLSTLHTKDALGTISRLQDMGIERYQVANALLMMFAQRLVRVLCPDCRRQYPARGDELAEIGFSFEPGVPLYAPVGCDACHGTGFRGRTGLFELLVLDDDFRRAIGEGADETAIAAMAAERGFKSYRQEGAEKALLGITTVEEVLQAS